MNPQEIVSILKTLIVSGIEPQAIGKVAMTLIGTDIPTAIKVDQPSTPATTVPQASSGSVMIQAGFVCMCDQCKAAVYKIAMDVRETMNKKDFVACFLPLGDAPELKMPLDTWADSSGNLAIDCPLCKGTKSLWIKGHGDVPFNDVPTGQQ